jgi:hypothetical protein
MGPALWWAFLNLQPFLKESHTKFHVMPYIHHDYYILYLPLCDDHIKQNQALGHYNSYQKLSRKCYLPALVQALPAAGGRT